MNFIFEGIEVDERETETETERQRQTETDRDRHTDRQKRKDVLFLRLCLSVCLSLSVHTFCLYSYYHNLIVLRIHRSVFGAAGSSQRLHHQHRPLQHRRQGLLPLLRRLHHVRYPLLGMPVLRQLQRYLPHLHRQRPSRDRQAEHHQSQW